MNQNEIIENLKWVISILGSLIASLSLISFIQRIGDIQLSESLSIYVSYYREIMSFLIDWIPLPFDWKFPNWYKDLMSIAMIFKLTDYRTSMKVSFLETHYPDGRKIPKILSALAYSIDLLKSLLFAPITILHYIFIIVMTFIRIKFNEVAWSLGAVPAPLEMIRKEEMWLNFFGIMLLITISGTVVFFVLNDLIV